MNIKSRPIHVLVALTALISPCASTGADVSVASRAAWPQWRGLRGDGVAEAIDRVYASLVLGLLLPALDASAEVNERYLEWVDERFLTKIRNETPTLYSWMIDRTKAVVARVAKAYDGEI